MLRYRSPEENPSIAFITQPERQRDASAKEFPFSIHVPTQYSWFEPWQGQKFPSQSAEYRQLKNQIVQKTFEFIEDFGVPMESMTHRWISSSPLTNMRFNPSPKGSAYGIYHSQRVTGARSLLPKTKIPNLLITGQNTLVPGLMGAAISGLRTAGFIVGIKDLIKDVRKVMIGAKA